MLKVPDVIVEVDWLYEHINHPDLIILDATIPKVTAKKEVSDQAEKRITSARFFDIKKAFSNQEAVYPNTMLSSNEFENKAQELGINNQSCIVVYDTHGIYSSPRAWWMFKTMGFDNVAVLNGGFPAWTEKGYPVEKQIKNSFTKGNFSSNHKEELLIDNNAVLASLNVGNTCILDARSLSRFKGESPEPRKDVRSGHIPTSKSLPYSSIISEGKLKSKDELKSLYQSINEEDKPMIFSCGTGITACVLALGASSVGYENVTVYDGSWTEWGSELKNPIEI
ncbi:MAG: sulfurtransferase [Flavobacteriaceae bacterium]